MPFIKKTALGLITASVCTYLPLMVSADDAVSSSDLPTLPSTVASDDLPTLPSPAETNATNEESQGTLSVNNDLFKMNGFVSTGALQTNADSGVGYNIPERGQVTNDVSFGASTLFGLQLTAKLNDQFSAVGQFVASGDDTNGNTAYDVDAAWAFLQYQVMDNVKVDLGRMRIPLFLYSDTIQVGYSYPYAFLPNEVYRIVPFFNMNGVSTIYQRSIGSSGWTLQTQPFFGQDTSQYDVATVGSTSSEQLTDYDENNLVGTSISISNGNMTLHGAYSHLELTATPTGTASAIFTDEDTSFYSLGAKFNLKNILLSAEYAHRDVPEGVAELTGFYGTIGYQLEKFLPALTYAHLETDNQEDLTKPSDEAPEAQESYTFSLAYYLTDRIDLKATIGDIHLLDGTNGMFSSDPGKSNVWLYGFGVDAIF
ncbi:MAG: hypothetical protein CL816_05100 [Coxiellaceae bacterium]|nr:hypothetical protein [Coxiellaceae bacterium]|tara:strand:+ start:771 stop:2048 length:1278 start_codon:yes stop_codon:yes gene_type:complete